MLFNIPDNLYYTSGIYTITNTIDERFYIGSTKNFKRRFRDHVSHLKKKNHANKYLQSFVNKYGIDKLEFNLLFLCKNTCMVYNEKTWIDTLKPQFNLKKIINRPYFPDELKFNQEEFEKILRNMPSPLDGMNLIDYGPHENIINRREFRMVWPSIQRAERTILSKYPKERNRQLKEMLKELRK